MSELKDQLKRVNERAKELEENPSELAKDALLAELRDLYDAVKGVEIDHEPDLAHKPPVPKIVEEAEPVEEPTPEPAPVAEKPEEPEPTPETVAEVVEEKEEPKPTKEPMIAEKQAEEGDNDEKILAGQFNKTPLSDLRSGIPLNEKFGIIRNLFKGNASDFGDAVLKLNNAVNEKEMTHYMELLQQRFSWDLENDAYKNFVGYVERKMMTLKPSNADADQ